MAVTVNWKVKSFQELTPGELYQVLRLRSAVFVVEQNCVYLDMDNKDQQALHLLGWMGEELAAYARILDRGLSFKEASIGRVITSRTVRRQGAGKELMEQAIGILFERYGRQAIRIGAQAHLERFYRALGFVPEGEKYVEDGILHVEMVLNQPEQQE